MTTIVKNFEFVLVLEELFKKFYTIGIEIIIIIIILDVIYINLIVIS
jgi:hypothetical protein